MINAVNMSRLPSPQDPSWVAITADDGTELLAILHDGTVHGTIENAGHAAQQFVTALRGLTEAIAAQAKAEALRDMERVLFDIENQHHIHDVECLCGFKSHRSRSRTEHITGLVRAATITPDVTP